MHVTRMIITCLILFISLPVKAATFADITQLYRKGKSEQALAELDTYLATLPKDSWGRNVTQARFLKGVILTEQKRIDEAIRIFLKLTLDYPDLPEPYNNLAALYVVQGKYEAARDTLERAMHTDTTYSTLQANLNDVYSKLSSQAYESTLGGSSRAAPERILELCENYGKMAKRVAGRKITSHADTDFRLIKDIQSSRTAAAQPPAHVDVNEMAIETPVAEKAPALQKPASHESSNRNIAAASPPSSTPPEAANSSKDGKEVLKLVQGWSSAWSNKNVKEYLAFYAVNFKPPGGESRVAWAAQRRERIGKPKSIQVTTKEPQVTPIDDTHAKVTFKQTYRSDALQTTGLKTLMLIKSGGKWLIQEERAGR